MTLQAHVDRYVALKRHLGYKFVNNERVLPLSPPEVGSQSRTPIALPKAERERMRIAELSCCPPSSR